MASSSLLSNKIFNKLEVNRLEALAIRSDNISSLTPSYLFLLFLPATSLVTLTVAL